MPYKIEYFNPSLLRSRIDNIEEQVWGEPYVQFSGVDFETAIVLPHGDVQTWKLSPKHDRSGFYIASRWLMD